MSTFFFKPLIPNFACIGKTFSQSLLSEVLIPTFLIRPSWPVNLLHIPLPSSFHTRACYSRCNVINVFRHSYVLKITQFCLKYMSLLLKIIVFMAWKFRIKSCKEDFKTLMNNLQYLQIEIINLLKCNSSIIIINTSNFFF